MAFCEQCGAQQPEGTRFCTVCGHSVGQRPAEPPTAAMRPPGATEPAWDPEAGGGAEPAWGPAPGGAPRTAPTVPLPAWLTADWPLVGLCVLLMLGSMVLVCALYGGVLSVVTTGGVDALIDGVTTGAYLMFTAFGVDTRVTSGSDFPTVGFLIQFFPLPLAALGVAATWLALRFAGPRLPADRTGLLAFAGKLALTFGIVMAVLASVLSIGDEDEGEGFTALVSGGEAWIYSTLLVGISALVFLHRRGIRALPDRLALPGQPLLPYAVDGARAFATFAIGMAPVAFIAAMIAVDSGAERLGLLFGMLATGVTMGIVGAAFAMGAAVALFEGHASLLKFGFPPESDAGAAPVPFFLLLVVAPAVVAWIVQRRLQSDRPATEQDAIKIGFVTAIAFALTAWVTVLLSQVTLSAFAGDESDGVFAFIVARPSPGAVLGLALIWGLVGGLGMAFIWARQQGAAWRVARPGYAGPGPSGPGSGVAGSSDPRPTGTWEAPVGGADGCRSCGAVIEAGSRFCARCGTPVT